MNYGMQRAIQLLVASSPEEKRKMLQRGLLHRICALITEYSNMDLPLLSDKSRGASVNSLDVLAGVGQQQPTAMESGGEEREGRKKFIVGSGRKTGSRRSSGQQTQQQQPQHGAAAKRVEKKKRPGSAESAKNNGVGYGRGSTKSRWNFARAVQERTLQEEHLIWLLSLLIAFLWGDQLLERVGAWEMALGHKGGERRRSVPTDFMDEMPVHLKEEGLAEQVLQSAVIPLLSHHLANDSVLDISQHMELYQVLLELTAGLAGIPSLLPHLVLPQSGGSGKSIAKELIPQFRDNLNNYPVLLRGITEADVSFLDFIRKINDFSEVILRIARQFERKIPAEKRVKTSYAPRLMLRLQAGHHQTQQQRRRSLVPIGKVESATSLANIAESMPHSASHNGLFNCSTLQSARQRIGTSRGGRMPRQMSKEEMEELSSQSTNEQYRELLREMQMSTWKLINDAGKPVLGFSFKKELRSVNPFSPTHKDRTKRIAKELASMHNSLPLNASNAIFVCMDETRCDMLKVLVTGPDDTPYQNGLFEFDVFFPVNYPQQPPKISFLTTGAGNVRFNPNLYNDGKICLSILGTWEGRPEEKWNPFCSLLQVLISIQGLIFVRQPYFNEPGFEKFQGTPKGEEFSRKYNLHLENATLVYAIFEQWRNGPLYFRDIIKRHFWLKREAVLKQAERWLQTVAEDIKNNVGQSREESDGMIDGIFSNPVVQRQNVRKLVEAFRDMENPLLADCRDGTGDQNQQAECSGE